MIFTAKAADFLLNPQDSYAATPAAAGRHLLQTPSAHWTTHKIQTVEKLTALETTLNYNGLQMSSFLCLFAITEKTDNADVGKHRLWVYLIMYTEDSEKYFKFAYSYRTLNHTERYRSSKLFSSNGFLYLISSIKPITYQPKSCTYIPYGYSQVIDFFLILKLCTNLLEELGMAKWTEQISFLSWEGGREGRERESPAPKFQKVDEVSCLAGESTWQRWMLMHHTPAYKLIHLITSYRLQNTSSELSGLRKLPGIFKMKAPAATRICRSACVLGDPEAH